MKNIITVKNLKKGFPIKNGILEAVSGIDLEVHEQEIFGFLGPNGAGKTTTLRMLTTLLPIDSGEAYIAGFNVKTQSKKVRRNIGFVSQKGGANKLATGYENLILQGRLYGLSKEEAISEAKELIDIFSLGDIINRFASTYSGGQLRRLDIALGMIHKPKILFLDEPTTGLDPQSRNNLWKKIKELKKKGITIFITSHYLDEIDFLVDRLAIMDKGKIVEVGTPEDLKREISGDIINIGLDQKNQTKTIEILKSQPYIKELKNDVKYLYLYVDKGETALIQILRTLDKEKIAIESISLSVPTLDDVFLKKTGHALRED